MQLFQQVLTYTQEQISLAQLQHWLEKSFFLVLKIVVSLVATILNAFLRYFCLATES